MIRVIWLINKGYNSSGLSSLRFVSLNCLGFRHYFPLIFLAVSGGVSAVGLGELRSHPHLGERPRLEIELLNAERLPLDAACFSLVQPSGTGDLPWLKRAGFKVRNGVPKILEIRPETPLREPILELAVYLGCGHEVSRQYVLLASPVPEGVPPVVEPRPARDESVPRSTNLGPRGARPSPSALGSLEAPPRLMPRRMEKRTAAKGMPDRLMVSTGIDVGEPSLRLATELFAGSDGGVGAKETQREILRLEFRMLMALNEQASSQMATAEKLRNMEAMLGELQQRAAEFALRVEQGAQPLAAPAAKSESLAGQAATPPEPVRPAPTVVRPAPPVDASSSLSEWSLYGVLMGVLFGLGGWLGWKNYRERQRRLAEEALHLRAPELVVDQWRQNALDHHEAVDLPVEPVAAHLPTPVDLELDGGESTAASHADTLWKAPRVVHDPAMSISATMVDEHFEANPVMELADIMLSFGRVKGAAQALQEYIDNNPQEALQPWIRLMDVYRMAGMRAEFETVARNLNQNFNVEVQQWEVAQSTSCLGGGDAAAGLSVEPHPESLEDMPRIAGMVCELWPTGDVVGYLYQLLRDNRGGKRVGFALPVVDEILFLIELKETSNRIQ
ncbi:MAG: hypothetical protein HYU74_04815 [Dechloromonas sp.]|nr:hypothetical protein [Dechloromonas sp.]